MDAESSELEEIARVLCLAWEDFPFGAAEYGDIVDFRGAWLPAPTTAEASVPTFSTASLSSAAAVLLRPVADLIVFFQADPPPIAVANLIGPALLSSP